MPLPPRPSDRLPRTREAARLGAFARGLGCGVGVEVSCKLSPGRAEAGRFLLSYGADERTAGLTARLLEELAFPKGALDVFAAEAPPARFLHLGYEGGAQPVLKAYCEGDPQESGPLYTACKVALGRPDAWAIDDYRISDTPANDAVREALGEGGLAQPCAALLAKAGAAGAQILVLEVKRRGAARRSFDVRLYGGGLTMRDAQPLIEAAKSAFALDEDAVRPLIDAGTKALGHLAAGRGDDGTPFLTLYWGAEDFA